MFNHEKHERHENPPFQRGWPPKADGGLFHAKPRSREGKTTPSPSIPLPLPLVLLDSRFRGNDGERGGVSLLSPMWERGRERGSGGLGWGWGFSGLLPATLRSWLKAARNDAYFVLFVFFVVKGF